MPVIAEACVVDEEIDIELFVGEPIGQCVAAVGEGQVSLEDTDVELGMDRTKRRGEFLETVFAPGHQNKARCERSELAREFRPQSGGCSCDQCRAAFKKFHDV